MDAVKRKNKGFVKLFGRSVMLGILTLSSVATGNVYEAYIGADDFIWCTRTLEKSVPQQIHAFENQRLWVAIYQNKLYWANRSSGTIFRSNTNGTMIEEIVTGLVSPEHLLIDEIIGKMFWISASAIMCANLDGSIVETIVDTGMDIVALATHAGLQKVYWFEYASLSSGSLKRSDLDGSNIEDITPNSLPAYPGMSKIASLFLTSDSLYFTSDLFEWGTIYQSNIDGTNPIPIVTGENTFKAFIFVNTAENTLFWVEPSPLLDYSIKRFFPGTKNSETIATIPHFPGVFSASYTSDTVYWSDNTGISKQIYPYTRPLAAVTTKVADIKTFFPPGEATGFIYWSEMDIDSFEFGTGAIYRIQSNGTNKETVHEGLYSVYGIAIDENHDTLYWADPADYKIYNSTLSGENISSIPGGYPPYYLTLDAANSILYWTGISSPSIISLDISNGDHSTLLTNNYPEGIVFDPTSQYIYYTDNHTPTTWRIRPDGTDNAQILALNSSYTNISIDSASRHLYWMCNNSIKRLSIEDSVYEELREFTGKQIALRTLDPSITIIGSRYAALGTHVILRVGGLPALVGNVTYEWYRNNALIPSTATNTYEIASAGYEHSGTYHVMVTDESKGIFMSSPFELIVTDSPLPAANLMLLGMLAIVLTGLGARSICKQD